MGLDMYLTKKIFIGAEYKHRKITGSITILEDGKPIPVSFQKVSEITEKAGYWRKANAIHKWFVDNVQNGTDDCRDYYVSRDQLQELLTACETVKAASKLIPGKVSDGYTYENGKRKDFWRDGQIIEDATTAHELLPAQEGFFFGSTAYDEYYLEDIDSTIEICKAALADETGGYYYQSSW